jgi:ADP-dependent NAD(P)H-hydrate dehydratase / NAD(P)H-hydrate epimerase
MTLKTESNKTEQMDSHLLVENMLLDALPQRKSDSHKGSFGSVAIIGGDKGMVGAVLLAARAALHCGAGRVYAAMLCKDAPSVDILQPEIMLLSPAEITQLSQLDCVVIGPGLGQSNTAIELLEFWLSRDVPILLDADALNLISSHLHLASIVISRDAETVITPHPGEASRLLDTSSDYIQKHRTESALKLAQTLRVTCVLKGAGSVCAHYSGEWLINTSGNPGLASGGTGDVLSGIVSALMAQGLSGLQAAKLGVYVHGAAADALVKNGIGPAGLTASEVAIEARNIINKLNRI